MDLCKKADLITSDDIMRELPWVKPSTIDYLVRDRIINSIRRGRGKPRYFSPNVIDKIKDWKGELV